MASTLDETAPLPSKFCPICERQAIYAFRPFCSKRCADVDLGKWFQESYAIPTSIDDESES
jgi:uncharacterized protein